jgi:hypothetical protein
MKINIRKLERAAVPHKGFGGSLNPRRWIQRLQDEGTIEEGYDGEDEAIHALCVALLQKHPEEVILVLDGAVDLADPYILAEYRTDRAAVEPEKQAMISAGEVVRLVGAIAG